MGAAQQTPVASIVWKLPLYKTESLQTSDSVFQKSIRHSPLFFISLLESHNQKHLDLYLLCLILNMSLWIVHTVPKPAIL